MREAITFLRLRPAETANELWAATRRREGTTAVEIARLDAEQRDAVVRGGLVPIATDDPVVAPLAWVLEPKPTLELT